MLGLQFIEQNMACYLFIKYPFIYFISLTITRNAAIKCSTLTLSVSTENINTYPSTILCFLFSNSFKTCWAIKLCYRTSPTFDEKRIKFSYLDAIVIIILYDYKNCYFDIKRTIKEGLRKPLE